MLTFLLIRRPQTDAWTAAQKARAPRYYRVEIAYNLFGEYSVLREWGPTGRPGQRLVVWFSNLREACGAADRWHKRAARRGYLMEGEGR